MKKKWLYPVVLLLIVLVGYFFFQDKPVETQKSKIPNEAVVSDNDVAYVVVNENVPEFEDVDTGTDAYEFYSELDELGRCGYAIACIGRELMPTEERESIGQVKPTGWHTVKYSFVDGKYLYNRCHLIGFQLTGENANKQNLITGTRFMNVQGMLPFENMVADYIRETDNHVLYRVTPVFDEDNLVASGVQMEALSIEDDGDGICFNVFVYNREPGVTIDYNTGVSCETDKMETDNPRKYVLDRFGKIFHEEHCYEQYAVEDPRDYSGGREELLNNGYKACKKCKP